MTDPRSPPGQRSGSHTPTAGQSDTTYHPAHEWLDDENDDAEEDEDMDYEPESERTEDLEFFDEEDFEDDEDDDEDDPEGVHRLFGTDLLTPITPKS